jgi:hypothetical protein
MRPARLLAVLAAVPATLALATTAHAAVIPQPFAADSGDACRYGSTDGTLGWTYGTTSPLPVASVVVKGRLSDKPLPADPGFNCRNDGYASTATFTAYAGNTVVDRQGKTADNATVTLDFTLGRSTNAAIDRIVVQVCRDPVLTLPPSYCGKPVTYVAPPVG